MSQSGSERYQISLPNSRTGRAKVAKRLAADNGFKEPWYAPMGPRAKKARRALLISSVTEVCEDKLCVHQTPRHLASFFTVIGAEPRMVISSGRGWEDMWTSSVFDELR